jgi:hypothetical protein
MKHCEECNLDFPGSYRFCGSCAAPLSESRRCPGCGELVEGKWTFCTSCGTRLSSEETSGRVSLPVAPKLEDIPALPAIPSSPPSPTQTKAMPLSEQPAKNVSLQEWYAAPDLFEEGTETTATPIPRQDLLPKAMIAPVRTTVHPQSGNGKTAPTLTMLSAYGESGTSASPEWQRRHAVLVGLLLLVFFGVLGFGGWYWWTHRAAAAQSSAQADSALAPAAADSSSSASSASSAPKTVARITTGGGADEEWKRLREKRVGAKPSEASEIISSLEEAEKKYPRDYRFPYERAKLSVKGIATHHEAFGALSLAGEKAIDAGKAQEMLDNLMADKDGDFYKLSRGHHEWQMLAQALGNKDKKALNELHH